jgi:hypothetical protein
MTQPLGDLKQQVEEFGREMAELLVATLPSLPEPVVDTIKRASRYVISAGVDGKGVPLFVEGSQLATLRASMWCRLDSAETYLAIEQSSLVIQADLDRTPLLRFDYVRDMNKAPTAHVQVHAHRGALSHLLSRTGHSAPHDMSALHIPVGGSRFRPCLEDVIQFLIQECGFDGVSGWEQHVADGRERWRRRQAAAVARDVPDEVARVLGELGYTVEPPATPRAASQKALRNW